MKILQYYDTVFEAEVVCGRLQSEGITAVVQNENLGNVLPLGGTIHSLKPYVAVADADAGRAAEILGLAQAADAKEKICPECGSSDVKFRYLYNGRPRRAVAVLVPLLCVLAGHSDGKITRVYNCRSCGHSF